MTFMNNSVNGILANFNKTVVKLRKLADKKGEEISHSNEIIEELIKSVKAAEEEKHRAIVVADKIENLLSE